MPVLLYIDPGSGSLLLQAILGVALGIGVFFKTIKHKVVSMFGKKRDDAGQEPHKPSGTPSARTEE